MNRRRVVGIALGALAGAAYGTGPLFFKAYVYPAGVGWIAMLMWRFMFATAVSWLWLLIQPRARAALGDLDRRTIARLLLTGAFFICNASVYYAAIEKIDISLVALLMSAYPALVAVLSLRLGYRFEGKLAWGSLAVVLLGTALTVGAIKAGKTVDEAIGESKASKFGTRPTPKLLDDPVPIPTLGSPVTGPADARITLVEFSDFQCPYCSKAIAQIYATLKAYPNDVRLIFKQYPLVELHPAAAISAAAALAAHRQGKFWEMHDVMFANRARLSRQSILAWANEIGLDMQRFTADLDSDAIKTAVLRDQADGDRAGVEGTPTVFLNGQRYNGDLAPDAFKPVIDGELKRLAAVKR